MIQTAFGVDCMSRSRVFEWFARMKDGRTSVDDDPRSGRPSTSKTSENIAAVQDLILSDRRLTIREISEELDLSFGSVQALLTEDLGMRRVAAKFVPRLLSSDQLRLRVSLSEEMHDRARSDSTFLGKIITGDETWVYGYDPETKRQSSQWKRPGFPRAKKVRQVKSNVKVMLTVFFDQHGIVHHEYAPKGQTINQTNWKC